MVDQTAPFPIGSNPRWRPAAILKNQTAISQQCVIWFTLCVCTTDLGHYNDCWRIWQEIRHFLSRGQLAILRCKEKERKSRSWEMDEKITPEEYTLDWSQSEIFLVTCVNISVIVCCYCRLQLWSGEIQGIVRCFHQSVPGASHSHMCVSSKIVQTLWYVSALRHSLVNEVMYNILIEDATIAISAPNATAAAKNLWSTWAWVSVGCEFASWIMRVTHLTVIISIYCAGIIFSRLIIISRKKTLSGTCHHKWSSSMLEILS